MTHDAAPSAGGLVIFHRIGIHRPEQQKERPMTNSNPQSEAKARPIYRLCFSAKNGTNGNGQASLSYPVEIGAAFERKDPTKGLIAKFHLIPMDFKEGVLFLIPAEADRRDQGDLLDDANNAEAGQ